MPQGGKNLAKSELKIGGRATAFLGKLVGTEGLFFQDEGPGSSCPLSIWAIGSHGPMSPHLSVCLSVHLLSSLSSCLLSGPQPSPRVRAAVLQTACKPLEEEFVW